MNIDYITYNNNLDNFLNLLQSKEKSDNNNNNNDNSYYCENLIKNFKLKCKIKGNKKPLKFPSCDTYQESQIDSLILKNVEKYEKYISYGNQSEYKRRIYEIPASDIKLKSKTMTSTMESIEEYCMDELLCDNEKVNIELIKMLIYDSQSTQTLPIKISTDINENQSEKKNKNVFGQLYLFLPSDHNGGEFIIRNYDNEKPIKISLLNSIIQNNFKYVAFKEHCSVDIESISFGYVVSLVFNLIKSHKRELEIEKPITTPPTNEKQQVTLEDELKNLLKDNQKIVYIFKYQYSNFQDIFNGVEKKDKLITKRLLSLKDELKLNVVLAKFQFLGLEGKEIDNSFSDFIDSDGNKHHHNLEINLNTVSLLPKHPIKQIISKKKKIDNEGNKYYTFKSSALIIYYK